MSQAREFERLNDWLVYAMKPKWERSEEPITVEDGDYTFEVATDDLYQLEHKTTGRIGVYRMDVWRLDDKVKWTASCVYGKGPQEGWDKVDAFDDSVQQGHPDGEGPEVWQLVQFICAPDDEDAYHFEIINDEGQKQWVEGSDLGPLGVDGGEWGYCPAVSFIRQRRLALGC